MMRRGSMVLELVIGMMISAIIALILFQSLSQSNGILSRVVGVSGVERRVAIIQQQFETDFMGIFSPHISESTEEDEEKGDGKEKKEKPKEQKKPEAQEDNGFKTFTFESDDRGLVKILSFITTNPLGVYQQPSARAVRVAYRVVADTENQGKFMLLRQESEELSLKKFEAATNKGTIQNGQKPIRSYEIARDIESIKFEFLVEKKENKQAQKGQGVAHGAAQPPKDEKKKEEEKPREFMSLDIWKKLSEEEKKKYETPEIPAFCSLKIFLNDEKKRTRSFDFLFFACAGIAPVMVKGATSLPSAHEIEQRKAGQAETDRMFLHGGIPQTGGR